MSFLPSINRLCRRASGILVVLLGICRLGGAEVSREVEAQVKAAFLPKLANFVEWPETAFATSNSPIVIAILGNDPFGPRFDEDLKSIQIHGRPVQVVRCSVLPTNEVCHLVFVGPGSTRLGDLCNDIGGRPILTVGDAAGFAHSGGMINFTKREGKLRFEINIDAVQAAGLKVSSRLLQVSTVIRGKEKS